MQALGIDIGGTGIKGAVVDTATGEFAVERLRIDTPRPATPEAVADVVRQITEHFAWSGPIGCTFPGVVKHGVVRTAANVDHDWLDLAAAHVFAEATGCAVAVVNDADAAGEAECRFGHEQARSGVVVLLTLGTGIGSAVVIDGELIPNTEFGHLKMGKKQRDAEDLAAESVRESEDLGWKGWANRLERLPPRARAAAVARPVRARWGRVEEGGQVHPPHPLRHPGGGRRAPEPGRHRGCRSGRRAHGGGRRPRLTLRP